MAKVGPAKCRTCGEELVTEIPATGDEQCIYCWQQEYDRAEKANEVQEVISRLEVENNRLKGVIKEAKQVLDRG